MPGSVSITGSTNEPSTLGLNNRAVGGGVFNVYTPGITGSSEMNNVGLSARIWGQVTSVGSDCFYLDDGSGVDNGAGNPSGVKVSWAWHGAEDGDPQITSPDEGWYVAVKGIVSSEVTEGRTNRVLRLRRQEDLQVITPEDTAAPTITITNPSGEEIHKASGETIIRLTGTASDAETGITSVQVIVLQGHDAPKPARPWPDATGTESWWYDWQNVQAGNYTIWASGTDFAGYITEVSRNVTVTDASVIYVDGSRPNDNGNGLSWSTAKKTVAAGLAAASSGNEVWVAQGTYMERITLTAGVGLYGGFVGNETYREQRKWGVNETILDGTNEAGSVVTVGAGAGPTTRLDGFTIRNGHVYNSGGGVYCWGTSPTIANNTITANMSFGGGGGIYTDTGSPIIINNNVVANSSGSGGGIYIWGGSPSIINNTIAENSASINGGGIYLIYATAPTISNNIIAFNSSGIYKSSSTPTLSHNCIYGNSAYDYSGLSPGPGDFSDRDPLLGDAGQGTWYLHIKPESPCIDAGDDSAVGQNWFDIDGEPRIQGEYVDIGADESDGCGWYLVALSTDPSYGTAGGTVTVTANVRDWNNQNVEGVTVCFSVSDGTLTEINGNSLSLGTTSGCGETDANGNATAEVTRETAGLVTLTTTAVNRPCGPGQSTTVVPLCFDPYRVGFLYDLCYESGPVDFLRTHMDQYLTRTDDAYLCVIYERITGTPFAIDESFNTVFLAMPIRDLEPSEIDALSAFVQSGRQKRIVLMGEYNPPYSAFNNRLNSIAAGLGMSTRFSVSGVSYDSGPNRARLCTVNSSHYLMGGVVNLWDAASSTFQDGWQGYAQPLAYMYEAPALPWILEEDTATAGSRILIHDLSIMIEQYNDVYDTVPDKNFKFIQKLCNIFPE